LRSETFATALEPFIAAETFHKVRNFTFFKTMKTQNRRIRSRKDRRLAAVALCTAFLTCMICHATYAGQTSPDQAQKPPDQPQKAPSPPPEAKPMGDPKTGVLKPPDVDPKMARQAPDVDRGITEPPPDKTSPPAQQTPPKVQPK
jgi:hypothetical protein